MKAFHYIHDVYILYMYRYAYVCMVMCVCRGFQGRTSAGVWLPISFLVSILTPLLLYDHMYPRIPSKLSVNQMSFTQGVGGCFKFVWLGRMDLTARVSLVSASSSELVQCSRHGRKDSADMMQYLHIWVLGPARNKYWFLLKCPLCNGCSFSTSTGFSDADAEGPDTQ